MGTGSVRHQRYTEVQRKMLMSLVYLHFLWMGEKARKSAEMSSCGELCRLRRPPPTRGSSPLVDPTGRRVPSRHGESGARCVSATSLDSRPGRRPPGYRLNTDALCDRFAGGRNARNAL